MSEDAITYPPEMLPRCPGAEVIVVQEDGKMFRAEVGDDGEIELTPFDPNTARNLN